MDKSIATLLDKICQVYDFVLQDKTIAAIDSAKDTLLKIAQAVQESARFIAGYSETKIFCMASQTYCLLSLIVFSRGPFGEEHFLGNGCRGQALQRHTRRADATIPRLGNP